MLGFDLTQCEYDTAGLRGTVERTVEIMGQIIEMAGGIRGFRSQFSFNDPSKDGLLALLLKFVARYKHEAFISEEEWRLVHLLAPGERPRFRMSGSALVPYVPFSLNNKELWKEAQIVVSPCLPDVAKLRRQSVGGLLESELRKHNLPTDCARTVRLSRAPYRAAVGG